MRLTEWLRWVAANWIDVLNKEEELMAQFDWVEFYKEFAHKLLDYENNREELIRRVKKIYEDTEINLPTLEKENKLVDIDPFTVFGLFNKTSMKETNRVNILNEVAKQFYIKTPVPTSFDSIPVLNNQNATFYCFVDERGADDIPNLWSLFASALKYADKPDDDTRNVVSKYFDLVINCKGNGNSKVTMGLYWIAPNSFLNLDKRNKWYIYESGKIPENVVTKLPNIEEKISASKYFSIVEELGHFLQSDTCSLKDFKELSFEAWRYSQKINDEKKANKTKKNPSVDIALADKDIKTIHYWIYSPGDNACKWDEFYNDGIMAIGWGEMGDLSQFATKDAMKKKMKEIYDPTLSYKNAAHATWQFANEMKEDDIVFVKKGMYQIVGRGVVSSDYKFNEERDDEYKNQRQMEWTNIGKWSHPGQAVMKTLTDITSYTDYVAKLNALFEEDMPEDVEEEDVVYPTYTKDDFLNDVYMDSDKYNTLTTLVKNKKNIIMQGAPGVGKTYSAKRLAYSMMGVKDLTRVMMIQFHQSYSYEDFIMGFRPSSAGFELKKGPFYSFCKKAEIDSENDYFFIIDEINRGNLSKIFGELFMLIESDKRGIELQLLYSDEKFSVPENVYIIGMMNTADRSLAMLDYALRRRFAFFELAPAFGTKGFKEYQSRVNNEKFNKLILAVEQLNEEIENDDTLGRGFRIGHSYFCTAEVVNDIWLKNVVDYELVPLLDEYWFDEPSKVKNWIGILQGAIK